MSTYSSPRPSITSLSVASPTVTSPSPSATTTPSISRAASPTRAHNPQTQRRNRTALRDYYNLKSAAPVDASNGAKSEEGHGGDGKDSELSELDREGFDAEGYVKGVLREKGLEGVLRVEGGLVGEIKGLDGERKALVYDNYSKLITATDTIRRMRTNMDPLTPTTSTLSPAVAHIAETARLLAGSLREGKGQAAEEKRDVTEDMRKRKAQQDTVRWVLATPKRLRKMIDEGKREDAKKDWTEIRGLLEKWDGVKGVQDLRGQCEIIMDSKDSEGGT